MEISKHGEESWKYDAQRSIFDQIWGVWIVDETLSWVFDISSQSKQKLRSNQRSKIVKILRGLVTVSSTFQDLKFNGHYNPSIQVDPKIMASTNCPVIGEQVAVVAQ